MHLPSTAVLLFTFHMEYSLKAHKVLMQFVQVTIIGGKILLLLSPVHKTKEKPCKACPCSPAVRGELCGKGLQGILHLPGGFGAEPCRGAEKSLSEGSQRH